MVVISEMRLWIGVGDDVQGNNVLVVFFCEVVLLNILYKNKYIKCIVWLKQCPFVDINTGR